MEKKAKLTNDRNLSLIWPHCSSLFGNVVVRKGEAEAAAVVVVSSVSAVSTDPYGMVLVIAVLCSDKWMCHLKW